MSYIGRDSFSGGFLVYINGVRVPSSSATISVQVDTPATASIQVPADPLLEGLGDEDLLDLAIFYLDTHYYKDPTWCLLYEGRITGQGYSNTPSQESMYFTSESNMNALQDLYLKFIKKGGGKITSSKSYPNQINIRGKSYKSFLGESLSGRPLARPFDLIDNIYFSVFGDSKAKLESRIAKITSKSLTTLVDKKVLALETKFERNAKRIVGDPEGYESEQVYNEVLQDIIKDLRDEWSKDNIGDQYTGPLETEIERQLREELKSSAMAGSPTAVTGFFARYFRKIRSRNHWACSPYIEGRPNDPNPIKAHIGGGVFPIFRATKSKRYSKSIVKNSGAMYGPGGSALGVVKNLYGLYFYRMSEILAPPIYTADKYGLPNDKFNSYGDRSNYDSWASSLTSQEKRLCMASYLTHPSSPFIIPPMCNVIFPSIREGFNMNNSYSNKPTRLFFNKKSPYGRLDFKVNSRSYATDSSRVVFPSIVGGAAQKAAGKASEDIDLLVFPEEDYRGPRPVEGQVHPTYMDLKKYASASRFGTEDRGDPIASIPSLEGMTPQEAISSLESVEKAYKDKISGYGLYYILARIEFLKQKFGAVSGDVSTMFNPYVVCGFPCAILSGDKSGLHYLGEVVSVTHSLSSMANQTSIQVGTLRSVSSVIEGIVADKFDVDSYPQEPVQEIRDLLQIFEPANEYYSQVFKKEEIGTEAAPDFDLNLEYLDLVSQVEETRDLIKSLDKSISEGLADTAYSQSLTYSEMREEASESLKYFEEDLKSFSSENPVIAERNSGFPAAFDFKSFLGWENLNSPSQTDFIIINELDEKRRKQQSTDSYKIRTATKGFRTSKLVPLPEVSRYFKSSAQSMKLVSRPVCTLEQYIDFYSCVDRDKVFSSTEGRGRGCRLGLKKDHTSGAEYYDVIRQYIGGPGVEPGTSLAGGRSNLVSRLDQLSRSGFTDLPDTVQSILKSKIDSTAENELILTGIGPYGEKTFARLKADETMEFKNLPDSRKNWQKLLLDYLTIIEGNKPMTGEG